MITPPPPSGCLNVTALRDLDVLTLTATREGLAAIGTFALLLALGRERHQQGRTETTPDGNGLTFLDPSPFLARLLGIDPTEFENAVNFIATTCGDNGNQPWITRQGTRLTIRNFWKYHGPGRGGKRDGSGRPKAERKSNGNQKESKGNQTVIKAISNDNQTGKSSSLPSPSFPSSSLPCPSLPRERGEGSAPKEVDAPVGLEDSGITPPPKYRDAWEAAQAMWDLLPPVKVYHAKGGMSPPDEVRRWFESHPDRWDVAIQMAADFLDVVSSNPTYSFHGVPRVGDLLKQAWTRESFEARGKPLEANRETKPAAVAGTPRSTYHTPDRQEMLKKQLADRQAREKA